MKPIDPRGGGGSLTLTMWPAFIPFPLSMHYMEVVPTHLKPSRVALLDSRSTLKLVPDPRSMHPKINGFASGVPSASFPLTIHGLVINCLILKTNSGNFIPTNTLYMESHKPL